jgi:2EXR family
MASGALYDQNQSTFFLKLSLELRVMIYRLAIPGQALHISCRNRRAFQDEEKQDNKLVATQCITGHDFSRPAKDKRLERSIDWGLDHQSCLREFKRPRQVSKFKAFISSLLESKERSLISMLLVCRRMFVVSC